MESIALSELAQSDLLTIAKGCSNPHHSVLTMTLESPIQVLKANEPSGPDELKNYYSSLMLLKLEQEEGIDSKEKLSHFRKSRGLIELVLKEL